ncbi:MAG TPA: hemerythrin domain-containing protein [Kofleriaceae bacterium]|nr:hemerythrin domain-containing protein [Kofleriaceae bacterium]
MSDPGSTAGGLDDRHRQLDDALAAVGSSLGRCDYAGARRRLAGFDADLDRHIRREEQLLFPVYELAAGSAAATTRMRHEHGRIRRLARALDGALADGDASEGSDVLDALRSVLALHFTKEDWVIYPVTATAMAPG